MASMTVETVNHILRFYESNFQPFNVVKLLRNQLVLVIAYMLADKTILRSQCCPIYAR